MTEGTIRTEDGIEVREGDRIFDYYTMKAGTIGTLDLHLEPRTDAYYGPEMQGSLTPWFIVHHDDGTRCLLNGQRICSLAAAERKGWT
jgi:hypothetical protein